jgi:restriction system protein
MIFKAIGLLLGILVLAGLGELHGFMVMLAIGVAGGIIIMVVKSLSSPGIGLAEQSSPAQVAPKVDPMEWVNYYELLGLGPTSSVQRITDRCLELAQACRPDVHGANSENMRRFHQIELALATLSNPTSRKSYDLSFQEKQARISAETKFDRLVSKHAEDLLRKRRQLVTDKGYGIEDQSKWIAEKDYFFNEIICPALGKAANLFDGSSQSRIENQLNRYLKSVAQKLPNALPMDGVEFENQCAKVLEQCGWKVSTTKASGDQGADIVAKQRGVSAVLQCKLYAKPVGNSAVQEAYAAKAHYGTKYAGVVSKSTYTKSAIALAASTGVLLLHLDELPALREKLKSIPIAAASR